MDILCDESGLLAIPAKPPFSSSKDEDKSPEELFKEGCFVSTVLATAKLIPRCIDDESPSRVLELWYLRIQSLLILQLGHNAAEEIAHNLKPLDSSEFRSTLVASARADVQAWKLRLLIVPVKTKGINQSAIQYYYTLVTEAREKMARLQEKDSEIKREWAHGIKLAALYVLSTLIALHDYMTAIHFLRMHYDATSDPQMAQLLALLHIIIGDTLGSRAWSAKIQNEELEKPIHDLWIFADEDTTHKLSEKSKIGGVADVYQGHIARGIDRLEQQAVNERSSNGTANGICISNLFVLYDLCFSNTRERHARLAQELITAGNTKLESMELIVDFSKTGAVSGDTGATK